MQAVTLGQACRLGACLIEVAAMLDHLCAEGAHRGVLLAGIAVRHQDADRQSRCACSQRQALAMVAAGGGDQATDLRLAAQQRVMARYGNDAYVDRLVAFIADPGAS